MYQENRGLHDLRWILLQLHLNETFKECLTYRRFTWYRFWNTVNKNFLNFIYFCTLEGVFNNTQSMDKLILILMSLV